MADEQTDPPRDLDSEVIYLSRRVADLEKKERPLPPFLQEQVRHREAYLTLLKDVNLLLASDWSEGNKLRIKRSLNEALGKSLEMWI